MLISDPNPLVNQKLSAKPGIRLAWNRRKTARKSVQNHRSNRSWLSRPTESKQNQLREIGGFRYDRIFLHSRLEFLTKIVTFVFVHQILESSIDYAHIHDVSLVYIYIYTRHSHEMFDHGTCVNYASVAFYQTKYYLYYFWPITEKAAECRTRRALPCIIYTDFEQPIHSLHSLASKLKNLSHNKS